MKRFSVEFDEKYKGYQIVGITNDLGFRCGYVRVPQSHRYFNVDRRDIDIECHGGLTYSGGSNEYPVHAENNCWWIGFDCSHFGDRIPGIEFPGVRLLGEVLRTEEYVRNECKNIVEQLIDKQSKEITR